MPITVTGTVGCQAMLALVQNLVAEMRADEGPSGSLPPFPGAIWLLYVKALHTARSRVDRAQ